MGLLRVADAALYRAKRAGGGRSEVFEGPPEPRRSVSDAKPGENKPGEKEVGPE
jgi:hypothetical protein